MQEFIDDYNENKEDDNDDSINFSLFDPDKEEE